MKPLKWLRIDCYGEEEQMKQVSQYRGMECWISSKFSGLTGGLFFLGCSTSPYGQKDRVIANLSRLLRDLIYILLQLYYIKY